MPSYLQTAPTRRRTRQSDRIPGSGQVRNDAGGFAWEISPLQRLRRFLILGSEGGSYYVGEADLTKQNVSAIWEALDDVGTTAVEEIVEISSAGRAPKNDPALYALACACAHKDPDVRGLALESIPQVARTATMLFHFVEFLEAQRGWGRAARRGVAAWYEGKTAKELAYQVIKYRQRDGWTHRDILRLCHPEAPTPEHMQLYDWICGREIGDIDNGSPLQAIVAYERAQAAVTPAETAALVREYKGLLPREALQPDHLTNQSVLKALLLAGTPMTALLRNLPSLTRHSVIKPLSNFTELVAEQLTDGEALRKARVHPLNILVALATYRGGESLRGDARWDPVSQIVDALDESFYASFDAVEPTGKRILIAIDLSGSMGARLSGAPISCREGAAALAMVAARTEKQHVIVGFTGEGAGAWTWDNGHPWTASNRFRNVTASGVAPLAISPRQRLDDVVDTISAQRFGPTDCALPMQYAAANELDVDMFVVLTDNETWHGDVHPSQALQDYRRKSGIDAKVAVISMTASRFSIADPNDPGMLDVVGFDTSVPPILADLATS